MSQVVMSKIKSEVERVLRKELGSIGVDRIELREGFDHGGDAAVFVTAFLPLKTPAVPGEISNAASLAVAHVINQSGDERFAYLTLRHPDDERPLDERSEVMPNGHA